MIDYKDPKVVMEVCEAATPGPWEVVVNNEGGKHNGMKCTVRKYGLGEVVGVREIYRQVSNVEENTAFIALSREALPYWVQEAERLRAEIKMLTTENLEPLSKILDRLEG